MTINHLLKSLMVVTFAATMLFGNAFADDHAAMEAKESEKKVEEAKPELKVQTTCPVMGGKINKSLYVEKDGKRIYVCCKGCLTKVEKNFDKYAANYAKEGVKVATVPHAQAICPVMGGKINKEKYVEQDGKRIYVCCDACKSKVSADFEKYEKALEKENVVLEKTEKE